MSTATMRLRRAGAGGLAAAVIAGTMFASAGSALAWNTGAAQGAVAVAAPLPSISTGTTGAGADVTFTLPTTWNIGDTISVALAAPNCSVADTTVSFANGPTVTPALGTGAPATDTLPAFTATATNAGAGCNVGPKVTGYTITFTNNGTNTVAPTLKLSGHKFAVGTAVAPGNLNLAVTTTGTNTQPLFDRCHCR